MPKEKMTDLEMAIYLTSEGYDVDLKGEEFNEDTVSTIAVEEEGYEFHFSTGLWQLEEYNIAKEGFKE